LGFGDWAQSPIYYKIKKLKNLYKFINMIIK